jgi:hypothetical protein
MQGFFRIYIITNTFTTMKILNNLTDLGIALDSLYDAPTKQIIVHISNKPYTFHVVLVDGKGIDCKISSMGANLWFRTKKGLDFRKYKSFKALQNALINHITKYVEDAGDLSFSLSDEVYTF